MGGSPIQVITELKADGAFISMPSGAASDRGNALAAVSISSRPEFSGESKSAPHALDMRIPGLIRMETFLAQQRSPNIVFISRRLSVIRERV